MSVLGIVISAFAAALGTGGSAYLIRQVVVARRLDKELRAAVEEIDRKTDKGKVIFSDAEIATHLARLYG